MLRIAIYARVSLWQRPGHGESTRSGSISGIVIADVRAKKRDRTRVPGRPMPQHSGSYGPCVSVPKARLCRAGTLRQVRGPEDAFTQPGRIELDVLDSRTIQQLADGGSVTRETSINIMAQQNVGRLTPVGDDDWAAVRRPPRAADILVEFPARNRGDSHNKSLDPTILHSTRIASRR